MRIARKVGARRDAGGLLSDPADDIASKAMEPAIASAPASAGPRLKARVGKQEWKGRWSPEPVICRRRGEEGHS